MRVFQVDGAVQFFGDRPPSSKKNTLRRGSPISKYKWAGEAREAKKGCFGLFWLPLAPLALGITTPLKGLPGGGDPLEIFTSGPL